MPGRITNPRAKVKTGRVCQYTLAKKIFCAGKSQFKAKKMPLLRKRSLYEPHLLGCTNDQLFGMQYWSRQENLVAEILVGYLARIRDARRLTLRDNWLG